MPQDPNLHASTPTDELFQYYMEQKALALGETGKKPVKAAGARARKANSALRKRLAVEAKMILEFVRG